ncbi:MAG: F0F1 ATP synthase subunit A [Alphaproteobacteria bacterium]|nr:F0F1 ATP synthase subunit A [Alphaproteobacteria bacterium]
MKMHNPLEQFNIDVYVPLRLGPLDISLSNASIMMLLSSFLIILFMWLLTRRLKIVPHLGQTIAETLYSFIKKMIEDTIGSHGLSILPFILTLFLFILFGNFMGLFPYAFTFTSHLSIVGAISLIGLLVSIVLGVWKRGFSWFHIFFPKGIPWALAPLMVPIEIISFLSKPFSLTVRLVMNMTVGHIMLEVVAGFVFILGLAGFIPLLFTGVLILFEVFIAVLQAYIFTILSCIYLSEAFEQEE